MAYDTTVVSSWSVLSGEPLRVLLAASSLNAVAALQLPGNLTHPIAKANKSWFIQALKSQFLPPQKTNPVCTSAATACEDFDVTMNAVSVCGKAADRMLAPDDLSYSRWACNSDGAPQGLQKNFCTAEKSQAASTSANNTQDCASVFQLKGC